MVRKLLVVYVVCALFYAVTSRADGNSWPSVGPVQHTFNVPEASKANISLTIRSSTGASLYRLQCRGGYAAANQNFAWSGDFECRLIPYGKVIYYSTLLTEDVYQNEDWESRGRFFAANLEPPCAHVPQFGSIRTFRLRGMKLTLHVIDPIVVAGKLKSLKLRVMVRADSSARRSIAAIVPFPQNAPQQCLHYFPNPAKFVRPYFDVISHSTLGGSYLVRWEAPDGVWVVSGRTYHYELESATNANFKDATKVTTTHSYYPESYRSSGATRYYRVRACYDIRAGLPHRLLRGVTHYYRVHGTYIACSAWSGAASFIALPTERGGFNSKVQH